MLKLRVVQALHGDCLILEYGSQAQPHYLLIDGGPNTVYRDHLKAELAQIREAGGAIELAVLSHVDDDHVNGLLDLLDELIRQRRQAKPETVAINGLWHNSFGQTLGPAVERSLTRQMGDRSLPRGAMPVADLQARSIQQGHDLTARARGLQIPINVEFRNTPDRLICLDNLDHPIQVANLSLQVVGPSRSTLKDLQEEWEQWLAKQEKTRALPVTQTEEAARALDKSVPNLSSIMLLVKADRKSLLLTGDGRGDHLLQGLEQAGLLAAGGQLHVDVFKLPHHGSARNLTLEVFERITADTYVICADGKYDNPDYQTLEWLVQAAMRQNRSIRIVATSETESTRNLVKRYPPDQSAYTLEFLEPGAHSITLDLSEPAPLEASALQAIQGIGPVFAQRLLAAGIATPAQVSVLSAAQLAGILLTGVRRAAKILSGLNLPQPN